MATQKEVIKIIGGLSALYPNAKVSRDTLLAYADLLKDLDAGLLAAAAKQCAAESEFFPTVARIRAKARDLTRDRSLPSPHEAWQEVWDKAWYRGTDYSHPLIAKAARAIGGLSVLQDVDAMVSNRSQFIHCYEQFCERAKQDAALLPEVHSLTAQPSRLPERGQVALEEQS